MKSRLCVEVLLASMLLAAVPACAENPTTISLGCAPWDGQTLVIKVGAPDAIYELTLWGAGLGALRAGERKTVHLKPDSSSQDDGVARRCGANMARDGMGCQAQSLVVHFERFEGQAGGTITGAINLDSFTVPFQGVVQDMRQPCG